MRLHVFRLCPPRHRNLNFCTSPSLIKKTFGYFCCDPAEMKISHPGFQSPVFQHLHSSQSQLPPGNYCFPEMCPLGSSGLRLYPSLSSGPCTHSTPLPGDTDAVPCLLPVFLRTGHPVWFFIPLCTSPESLVHSESLESGRNLPLCLE